MTAPAPASTDPVRTSRAGSASALWRDIVRAAAGDPGFAWALGLGVVLVALGLLGFIPNPLVGAPSARWGTPLLVTGDSHDVVHLIGGAVALHAALGLSRARRNVVLVVLGTISLLLLALGILDGRWLGLLTWPVGLADQLLHLIAGLGSILVGLAGLGAFEGGGRPADAPSAALAAPTAPTVADVAPVAAAAPTVADAAPVASAPAGAAEPTDASAVTPAPIAEAPAVPDAPVEPADGPADDPEEPDPEDVPPAG